MHEYHRERLRRQYLEEGINGFSEYQVLELLLTYAIPRKDTNALAHLLIDRYGTLGEVLNADIYDLCRVPGIGMYSATLIVLAGSLERYVKLSKPKKRLLNTPALACEYCLDLLGKEKYETVYLLSLDNSMRLVHADKLSSGTLTEAAVYPRLVLECALRHQASSVILTHNHPSGNLEPSISDYKTTQLVLNALDTIGIRLFDHIIVGGGKTLSMLESLEGQRNPDSKLTAAEPK